MTDGPRTVTPKDYNSCVGCDYVDKAQASSGGIKDAPTYYMYCDHPTIVESVMMSDHIPTRSVTRNLRGDKLTEQRTPNWCPFIQGIK